MEGQEPSYKRRWWTAAHVGWRERLGGRWGGITLIGPLVAGGMAGFVLSGGDELNQSAAIQTALVALVGVALWVAAVWFWSLVVAPSELDSAIRADLATSMSQRDEALRVTQALRARKLDQQTLGAFLTEGNRLRSEAWRALSDAGVGPTTPVASEHDAKAQEWAGRVIDYLDGAQEGASDLFNDETPTGMQMKVQGYEVRSNIGNWYDRRLAKLRELALRSRE